MLLSSVLALLVSAQADSAPVVLILGDSLSAAYGIAVTDGWVALLERKLAQEGYPHRVVNASISGETTGGGRRRLGDLLVAHQPRMVILELGANDGLRGIPLLEIERNFKAIRQMLVEKDIITIVLRMVLPPNYGSDYTRGFNAIFDGLSDEGAASFVSPFFLENVALNPELLQTDGLHPTAAAQPRMLKAVWPTIATGLDVAEPTR
ncbi:MAG: arylesterase [Gammaproteobacteria bacterium]|nr:arylesterase [Gammaproteobacteria bacterium]